MAASIKIALELDDRGYIQGLKTSVDQTKALTKEAEKLGATGAASFSKLSAPMSTVITNLKGIAAAYVGIQSVMSSFKMADEVNDLASASGVGVATILQLKGALAQAGGNAEDAGRLISQLTNTLGEAQQGSASAQDQLRRLGFTLQDMGNLSPEDALKKTVQALANITNPVERNSLAFQILGKSARNIDWNQVAGDVGKATDKYKESEAAIKAAGETMDTLAGFAKDLQLALVTAAAPIADLVQYIKQLSENSVGLSAVFAGIKVAFQAVAVIAANVIFVVETLVSDFIALAEAGAKFAQLDFASGVKVWQDRAEAAAKNREELDKTEKKILGIAGANEKQTKTENDKAQAAIKVRDAFQQQINEIRNMGDAYEKANTRAQEKLESDYKLIGASQEERKQYEEKTRIYNAAADAIEKLREKQEALTDAQKRAGMGGAIDEEIKKIEESRDAAASKAEETIRTNEEQQRSFETGWENAFKKYSSDANNAAMQAQTVFGAFTKGFEDMFVEMVQTGTVNWKNFANMMIAEIARIQAKKLIAGMMGSVMGPSDTGGASAGMFSGLKGLLGFANGGTPPVGVPSIVGENGPELFVPKQVGTVVPNHMLGQGGGTTNVTYNIQAVDASSFRSLLSQDPELLFSLTERGRARMAGGFR